jgi:hypothetical protein
MTASVLWATCLSDLDPQALAVVRVTIEVLFARMAAR